MKPLTVAAALEAGVITPNSIFDTNPGWMPNGRYRTTDHHNYGVLTTTGVITKSSNVGAAKIVAKLPNQRFYDFLRRFGYGQSTQQRLPRRVARRADAAQPLERYHQADHVLRLRPVGDAAADRAGLRCARQWRQADPPTFVKGERHEPKQVLDPPIAHEVMRMMQTVTEPGGTATQAAILGYHVAGKTGTARKFSESGGYTAPLRVVLRRRGAGAESALLDGGRGQRSRYRARLLRRPGVRAGVPATSWTAHCA